MKLIIYLDGRARKKDTVLSDVMLLNVTEHLIQGSCRQCKCSQKEPSNHWKISGTPDLGHETEIEVVWLHLKIFWFRKDDFTLHITRKRKKGKQKKRWEDNFKE